MALKTPTDRRPGTTTEIRLVFVDVDGTLVGASGEIPSRVWVAVEKLRAHAIPISVCSGRPAFGSTRDYAARLEPNGFHIFQNGASVVHLGTGESISRPIAESTVARLVGRARRTRQFLELYSDAAFAFEGVASIAIAHAKLLGVPFQERPLADLKSPIVRAQWIVPHAESEPTIAELERDFPDLEVTSSTSPLMPEIHFVMVTVRGVNKASAVEAIANRSEISLQNVMFVGDGDNDVGPLLVVGHSVAMRNASEKARAAAKFHVGDVDDGAVAEAFALALGTVTAV